jgi:hypothetical protein
MLTVARLGLLTSCVYEGAKVSPVEAQVLPQLDEWQTSGLAVPCVFVHPRDAHIEVAGCVLHGQELFIVAIVGCRAYGKDLSPDAISIVGQAIRARGSDVSRILAR